jgi:hypothetical protein
LSRADVEILERSEAFVYAHPLNPFQRFIRISSLRDELPPELWPEFLRLLAAREGDGIEGR